MLTNDAINQFNVESGTRKLLMEWLGNWFNGTLQTIGADQVTFPQAEPVWAQAPPVSQPMKAPEIRVVMLSRDELYEEDKTIYFDGKRITELVLFNFWISSSKKGHGERELEAGCVADLLKAILTNPDTRADLNLKGIYQLRPTAPEAIPSKDFGRRLVACRAQLQYGISYGGNAPPTMGETEENTVGFFRDLSFVTGEYFLGSYSWPTPMEAVSANIIGWGPVGADAVVELEVNGVLTGYQLTLPAAVNSMVTESASTSFGGLVIPAGQLARWQIVSGPSGQNGAWKASIGMNMVGS